MNGGIQRRNVFAQSTLTFWFRKRNGHRLKKLSHLDVLPLP